MNEVLKAGWCLKEGGFIHNVKKRWFVLTFSNLYYYKKIDGPAKGNIEIKADFEIRSDPTFRLQPCFTISSPSLKKVYYINPENDAERDDWISMLRTCVDIQIGMDNPAFTKNYFSLYNNYINISERLWDLDRENIPSITKTIKVGIQTEIYRQRIIFYTLREITFSRLKSLPIYADLYCKVIHELKLDLKASDFADIPPIQAILVLRGLIDGEIKGYYENFTEEQIFKIYKKDSFLYTLFWDDFEQYKPPTEEDIQECQDQLHLSPISAAAKFGSIKIFNELARGINAFDEETYKCAYMSGNMEIINKIKQTNQRPPLDCVEIAVRHHHNDIVYDYCRNEIADFSWHNALIGGNFKAFFDKLFRSKNFTKRDNNGQTPLIAVTFWGSLPIVKFIQELGGNIDALSSTNTTALNIALEKEFFDIAAFYIEKGANLDLKSENGCCPLILCVQNNSLDCVNFLMKYSINVDSMNYNRETALMIAVKINNADIIKALIKMKANPNIPDDNNNTPLIHAINNDNLDIVKTLVNYGAKICLEEPHFTINAFLHACYKNRLEIVKYFIENGHSAQDVDLKGRNGLMIALENGYKELSVFLMKHIKNYYQNDITGLPTIAYAAQNGHVECFKHIIESMPGFDINTVALGSTILHYGVRSKNAEIVEYILTFDPETEHFDENGNTPLVLACLNKDVAVVKVLVEYGVDINKRDLKGNTALMHCCINFENECGKYLIEHHADMEMKNNDGIFPLIAATIKKNVEMIKTLLDNHANINATDSFGNTALIQAASMNIPEVAEVLIAHNADASIQNRNGNDALSVARKVRSTQTLKIIAEYKGRDSLSSSNSFRYSISGSNSPIYVTQFNHHDSTDIPATYSPRVNRTFN